MTDLRDLPAMTTERSCSLTAVALSSHRREGTRLVTGGQRRFSLNAALTFVHVPYPTLGRDWTRRTLTCGIALQCSPSKDRLAQYRLNELSARELKALTLVEAGVALGWIASTWPGLLPKVRRVLPDLEMASSDTDADEMLNRAIALARTGPALGIDPLLGRLPLACTSPDGLSDKLRRTFGRMPWTSSQKRLPRPYSVPVGGDGGVRNSNLPPPSRPQDNDLDVTPQHRPGIPYPEWNASALRLVSALFQGHETPDGSMQSWRLVADEIDCHECLEEIAIVLATKLAEQMAAQGPEAMCELDREVAHLLDLAKQED
jgi:nitric oxide reductase NorD protein